MRMMIVADIDEETQKMKKLGRPKVNLATNSEVMIQESTGPRADRATSKKRQVLEIKENKKIHYDTRKRIEKAKRLDSLRSNYSRKPENPPEDLNN